MSISPFASAALTSRFSFADDEPVSSARRIPSGIIEESVLKCCEARTSVGAMSAD